MCTGPERASGREYSYLICVLVFLIWFTTYKVGSLATHSCRRFTSWLRLPTRSSGPTDRVLDDLGVCSPISTLRRSVFYQRQSFTLTCFFFPIPSAPVGRCWFGRVSELRARHRAVIQLPDVPRTKYIAWTLSTIWVCGYLLPPSSSTTIHDWYYDFLGP